MNQARKIFIWVTAGAFGLLILLATFLLLVPRLVHTEPIKAELLARLSEIIPGRVEYERLDLSFLPRPHAKVHGAAVSLHHGRALKAAWIELYPEIFPLLTGELRLAEVRFESPVMTLAIEKGPDDTGAGPSTPPLALFKEAVLPVLAISASKVPGLRISIGGGRLEVVERGGGVRRFEGIAGRVELPPGELEAAVFCRSGPWGQLSFETALDLERFRGKGEIRIAGLRLDTLLNRLMAGSGYALGESSVDLQGVFEWDGRDRLHAEVRGAGPGIRMDLEKGSVQWKDLKMRASLEVEGNTRTLEIEDLELGHPRVRVRGTLTLNPTSPKIAIELRAEGIDVEAFRAAGLALAGEQTALQDIFKTIKEGNVPWITLRSSGDVLGDLAKLEKIAVEGQVSRGKVLVPETGRDLNNLEAWFSWDKGRIQVRDAGGSLGQSSFSGLAAKLDLGKEPRLQVSAGQASLSLEEIHPWLASYEGFAVDREALKGLAGTVDLTALRVEGPLSKLSQWQVEARGRARGVLVQSDLLPAPLEVPEGEFEVLGSSDARQVRMDKVRITFQDASLTVSGTFKQEGQGPPGVDVALQGELREKAAAWLWQTLRLPPDLALRVPVRVQQGHLAWGNDGSAAFKGELLFEAGPRVTLDFSRTPAEFLVHGLDVRDQDSQASLALGLKKDALDLEFSGTFSKATMARIFAERSLPPAMIKGDLKAHILLGQPLESRCQGTLMAEDVPVPWGKTETLHIEKISVDARERHVDLHPTTIRLDDQRLSLSGGGDFSPRGFGFDMDLAADALTWEDIRGIIESEGGRAGKGGTAGPGNIPLEGVLRLRSKAFSYGPLTWSPFDADLTVGSAGIKVAVVNAAICGISTPGTAELSPEGLSLRLSVRGENQPLDGALQCLPVDAVRITGDFDLKGEIAAAGAGSHLKESLKGKLEFAARKGTIYRLGILAKALAVLNVTEIYRGQFPEFTREGFAYRSILARGEIQNGILDLEEFILEGKSMEIVADGEVDLNRQAMDIKALFAPLKTGRDLVRKTPLLKHVLSRPLIAVPLRIEGKWANPQVTMLSPAAVGSELLGILKRTLTLPVRIIEPSVRQDNRAPARP